MDKMLNFAFFLKIVQSRRVRQLCPSPENFVQRTIVHQVVIGFRQMVMAKSADNLFVFE
jgi:hypothetical protein